MEKVERPVLERRKIALRLHPHVRGGQRVFELRHVGMQFGEDVVLADVELTVVHGERVGFVGANGAGKSVLLKTVVGELEPTEGEVWVGPSIRIGYLAQDQETLDLESSPLDTVRLAHRCSEGEAVALLMKFLFPYEQVRRANKLLSGGERTRLQLLLLMLAQPNLLVLDEPTNHLDIDSVEALESALEEFDRHRVRDLPRPLLPRPDRRPDRRGRRRRDPLLRGRLFGLVRALRRAHCFARSDGIASACGSINRGETFDDVAPPSAAARAPHVLRAAVTRIREAGVQPLHDTSSPEAGPFPSNRWTTFDLSQKTGLRIDLPKPDCAVRPSDCADIDVLNTLDGFNLQPRISIPFTGAIDPASVNSSNVFLVSSPTSR